MLKLDSQRRLALSNDVCEIAGIPFKSQLYCIYCDTNSLILKLTPNWGVDKVMGRTKMDDRNRIMINQVLKQAFDFDEKKTHFIIWAEPGALHIEKVEP